MHVLKICSPKIKKGFAMFTPNELVFTFGSFYVSVNFGENPSRNANVRVHADGYTDRGKLDFSERERPLGLYVIARPSVVCLSVCRL